MLASLDRLLGLHAPYGQRRIAYRVDNETPFVFNVEAARHAAQTIASESLILAPSLEVERWTMPESGSRCLRVHVPPGPFTL